MSSHNVSKVLEFLKRPLTVMLALGLAVRLILMPLLSFELDLGYWLRITGLLDAGFGLYDTPGYYYTPIWGYLVALFSTLGDLLGVTDLATFVPALTPYTTGLIDLSEYVVSPAYAVLMKAPIVIADTVTAFLLYDLVKGLSGDRRKAEWAFGLWYLCPFIILISSVHGMFDSISAMLILLTITFINKRNYFFGGVAFALAVLTKYFPAFLIFFLVAYVFRREGIDRRGLKHLLNAIAGSISATFVILLPTIIEGQFWESLYFLTSRVGLSTEFLYSISTPTVLTICIVTFTILTIIGLWIHRTKYPSIKNHLRSMDPKVRDRNAVRLLIGLGILATVMVVTYSTISVIDSVGATFMGFVTNLGMKVVMLISVYTMIIEMYLAYRLLVAKEMDDRTVFSILMLSSVVIFLWPPLPQYVVVIVPFLIIYLTVVDSRFKRPFYIFVIAMTLYELFANQWVLFTLAEYTDILSFDIPLAIVEFFSDHPIVFLSGFILVTAFEYIATLNLIRVWYVDNKEVSSDDQ